MSSFSFSMATTPSEGSVGHETALSTDRNQQVKLEVEEEGLPRVAAGLRPLPTGSFLEERAPLEKNERFPRSTSCIVIVATNVSFAGGANSRVTGELGIEIELKMTRLATAVAESVWRKIGRGFLRHDNRCPSTYSALRLRPEPSSYKGCSPRGNHRERSFSNQEGQASQPSE